MRYMCTAGSHVFAAGTVRNQGFEFGRCGHCHRDLIRSGRQWRSVPKGFRVVWRRPGAWSAEFNAAQLMFDLPLGGRAFVVPALPVRRKMKAAAAAEILALAMQWLAWAFAEQMKRWRISLFAPRPAIGPTLCLSAR